MLFLFLQYYKDFFGDDKFWGFCQGGTTLADKAGISSKTDGIRLLIQK